MYIFERSYRCIEYGTYLRRWIRQFREKGVKEMSQGIDSTPTRRRHTSKGGSRENLNTEKQNIIMSAVDGCIALQWIA